LPEDVLVFELAEEGSDVDRLSHESGGTGFAVRDAGSGLEPRNDERADFRYIHIHAADAVANDVIGSLLDDRYVAEPVVGNHGVTVGADSRPARAQ
jgi:hypothetical protein